MSFVRATIDQPLRIFRGDPETMARPCSPARRAASGSRKMASDRADSAARYWATQRAVSETFATRGDSATVNDLTPIVARR